MNNTAFRKTIWDYYKKAGRDMPWRKNITPYRIVVSEIMLQQTQASRVAKKFDSFIQKFPSFESLSNTPLSEVLKEWQGLGYNRRALNLHRLSKEVMTNHGGNLPQDYDALLNLPGIGPNTAGSIVAFAWNIPHPFIETNIRTVFIHFFFKKHRGKVHDKKLLPLIKENLDRQNPREWYYALMDYGAMLKRTEINPSRKSSHHLRQSEFKGSNRELRSHILKEIIKNPLSEKDIFEKFSRKNPQQIVKNIGDLTKEGFIVKKGAMYRVVI
jgi:A/G-specific adenine glycosylase